MFLLDSLMISGIRWALETVVTAAETEMNDDSALRDQLLEAEMRREMGEIDDHEFREIETSLLARIREIKARREGGTGPLAFGRNEPLAAEPGSTFQIEAEVSGDFHEPASPTAVPTTPSSETVVGPLPFTPVAAPPTRNTARRTRRRAAAAGPAEGGRHARRTPRR